MAGESVTITIGAQDNASAVFQKVAGALNKLGNEGAQAGNKVRGGAGGVDSMTKSLNLLKTAIGSMAMWEFAKDVVRTADTFTRMGNLIRLTTKDTAEYNRVSKEVYAIAQRTRAGYEGTAEAYARIARSTERLGFSQKQVLRATETVNKAFQLGGATAKEASATAIQFGQALALGTLQGEELRSVMEQAPMLARGLADALGISIGELRRLAPLGVITSKMLMTALGEMAEKTDESFAKIVPTVEQGWTVMKNALGNVVSEFNKATVATTRLSETFVAWGTALDGVSTKMAVLVAFVQKYQEVFKLLGLLVGGAAVSVATGGTALVGAGIGGLGYGLRALHGLEAPGPEDITMDAVTGAAPRPIELFGVGPEITFGGESGGAMFLAAMAAREAERVRKEQLESLLGKGRKPPTISTYGFGGIFGGMKSYDERREEENKKASEDALKGRIKMETQLVDVVSLKRTAPKMHSAWQRMAYNIREWFAGPAGVFNSLAVGMRDYEESLGSLSTRVRSAVMAGMQTYRAGLQEAVGGFLWGEDEREDVPRVKDKLADLARTVAQLDFGTIAAEGAQGRNTADLLDLMFGQMLGENIPEEYRRQIEDLQIQVARIFTSPTEDNRNAAIFGIADLLSNIEDDSGMLARLRRLGENIVDAIKEGMKLTINSVLSTVLGDAIDAAIQSLIIGPLGTAAKKLGGWLWEAVGGGDGGTKKKTPIESFGEAVTEFGPGIQSTLDAILGVLQGIAGIKLAPPAAELKGFEEAMEALWDPDWTPSPPLVENIDKVTESMDDMFKAADDWVEPDLSPIGAALAGAGPGIIVAADSISGSIRGIGTASAQEVGQVSLQRLGTGLNGWVAGITSNANSISGSIRGIGTASAQEVGQVSLQRLGTGLNEWEPDITSYADSISGSIVGIGDSTAFFPDTAQFIKTLGDMATSLDGVGTKASGAASGTDAFVAGISALPSEAPDMSKVATTIEDVGTKADVAKGKVDALTLALRVSVGGAFSGANDPAQGTWFRDLVNTFDPEGTTGRQIKMALSRSVQAGVRQGVYELENPGAGTAPIQVFDDTGIGETANASRDAMTPVVTAMETEWFPWTGGLWTAVKEGWVSAYDSAMRAIEQSIRTGEVEFGPITIGVGGKPVPSLAGGIARVPGGVNQPYPAILHGGERVLTATENQSYGSVSMPINFNITAQSSADGQAIVEAIRRDALPMLERQIDLAIRRGSRFGSMEMDRRTLRSGL